MNHPRLAILAVGFSVFAILAATQTPHEPIYRHLPTENEPIFLPPQGPPAPPGPPPEWALEGDRQREKADLVVEYFPQKASFSMVKPFRDPHELVKEANLPKFLTSRRIRRNLVIVTFGKITLFGKSKPERDQVFDHLATQFRKLGFRKIIFQQEVSSGPYKIGEQTLVN